MFEFLSLVGIPSIALAQAPCEFVSGCSATNTAANFLAPVANLLIYTVAGISTLFVVWGGFQMLISTGDDSKINTGRMSIFYGLIGFAISLAAQVIVSFIATQASAASSSNPIGSLLQVAVNSMLYLFNVVFTIIVIVAGIRLVVGRGKDEETESARRMLFYAIVGAITVNVAKAIVTAVLNVFA